MRWYQLLSMDGWIWIVCLVFGVIYWHGHLRLQEEMHQYQQHKNVLEEQTLLADNQKKELQKSLAHCNDKEWIEWCLMYYLGMVPKGTTKIILEESK